MPGFTRTMAEIAIHCGWSRPDILELHEWCAQYGVSVSDIFRDMALVEGRYIHYSGWPTDRLGKAIEFSPRTDGSPPTRMYTDGSGTSAATPAGIGVVVLTNPRRYIYDNIGNGTNNRAELWAIRRALVEMPDTHTRLHIHSDSQYALGIINRQLGWAAQKNEDLVNVIRKDLEWRGDKVEFTHVNGHVGVTWNEVADKLAHAGRTMSKPVFPAKLQKAMEIEGALGV